MKIIILTDDRKGAVEMTKWLKHRYEIIACVFDFREESELRNFCISNDVPVLTSTEIYSRMNDLEPPDLIISYLFRHRILPKLINFAPVNNYGYRNIINFHPAPLPDAKGVGMSSQAIIQGFTEWGVSVHYVNERFDDGDLIEVKRFPITESITSIELQLLTQIEQLRLLKKIVCVFETGGIVGHKQSSSGQYFSNKQLQSCKEITGKESAEELEKKVNGLFYPPYDGAYLLFNGRKYTLVNENILGKLYSLYQKEENEAFRILSEE